MVTRALFNGMRRHPMVAASPILLLSLLVLALNPVDQLGWFNGRPAREQPAMQVGQPPVYAQQVMDALVALDAALFWEALDQSARTELAAQGVEGQAGVQEMFDRIHAGESRIRSHKFVYRYESSSGETISLFIATRRGPDGAEREIPFVVTTDAQGLVTRLE